MQPLFDNLNFIKNQFGPNERKARAIEDMKAEGKIQISPLAYIRGRSLSNVIFIVDEAQNLTPHEVKTIITRAGENTKIILTGDIRQIDTPYLDEQSNGLTYVIDRLRGKNCIATSPSKRASALSWPTWPTTTCKGFDPGSLGHQTVLPAHNSARPRLAIVVHAQHVGT